MSVSMTSRAAVHTSASTQPPPTVPIMEPSSRTSSFGAFIAGDGAVDLHDGRHGALLAQAAKTHDFVVNIHSDQLYRGRRGGRFRSGALQNNSSAVRISFSSKSSRGGLLYIQPTGVVRETGGCLFFQPAQATSACAGSGLRKVYESTVNALSYFLLRLPCAALTTLVSTRESILFRVPPSSQCFRGG